MEGVVADCQASGGSSLRAPTQQAAGTSLGDLGSNANAAGKAQAFRIQHRLPAAKSEWHLQAAHA